MILSNTATKLLGDAISVAKMVGIESVMINEGMIRGVSSTMDAAIITDLDLGLSNDINIGVGRLNDLGARLAQFENCEADLKVNENKDVSTIIIKSKNAKTEFRCSASSMVRYPKKNEDEPSAIITLSADEAKMLSRAISTMGAEHIVIQLMRNGDVRFEVTDEVKDRFEMLLDKKAEIVNEETTSFVFTYLSKLLAKILSASSDDIEIHIGVGGSATINVKGYDVILFAQLNFDEENEDF